MIYGNGVHVVGYMLITAWISSLLEKFAGHKIIKNGNDDENEADD